MNDNILWWRTGIIYQVYPRSFQDSNNDGIGDIRGIIDRLSYLHSLGVKALWLSPVYPSPMADFGYDIMDYTNIHSIFGDLNDFDALLKKVHDLGMKLLLDLVPNHTSSLHPWFVESRSSRDNPYRDYYIWRDPTPDGSPPNNWRASFGGSAWELDPQTGQYYYHAFLKEQPDLNWRNENVHQAMFNIMRFWLSRGVDGFRIDVLWHLIKDSQFRDNPVNADYKPYMATYDELLALHSTDQPEVHFIVKKMIEVLNEFGDRLMIGEIYLPLHKLVMYYGADGDTNHLPFNFQLITLPWNATVIAAAIEQYESMLPPHGWPNWVLGNHDQPRIASRVGSEQSKIAAMLLLTLRGTPTLYYGDEIGMKDVPVPADAIQDPQGLNMPDKNLSRDPARTPMQWTGDLYAGFSGARPWLPVERSIGPRNVAYQLGNPESILNLYTRLIALRNNKTALTTGSYRGFYSDHQILSYLRTDGQSSYLIILNLTHRTASFRSEMKGTIIISTSPELEGQNFSGRMELSGDEGFLIELIK